MYAIIKNGGRQVKAELEKWLQIDYQEGAAEGDSIEFNEVLMIAGDDEDVKIGQPTIPGAKVIAKVLRPVSKGPKLVVAKLRRRKNSRRKTGHRQVYTLVRISEIIS